ncbi:hypothetical protein SynBIOSE41_02822 [Synechococcus sp. BIOS-E4-1]|uniref:hypothetical protein n=1 Tax=Synechococcus sp. BIOS-E4-1 TaxID=1400864 RepID=UPI0016442270|nr:hypothetical protein [Synechococcus sp. BIOS-E4-1]QNI55311.1 hypothetical protein SynBIOSE41_02822 [Synechococcus sp. BIOS-E4-1]
MKDKTANKDTDANQNRLSENELKTVQCGMTWNQFVSNQDNLGLEEAATAHDQGVWRGP